jgi:hypothetical protein
LFDKRANVVTTYLVEQNDTEPAEGQHEDEIDYGEQHYYNLFFLHKMPALSLAATPSRPSSLLFT